jgi:hypothetical protein
LPYDGSFFEMGLNFYPKFEIKLFDKFKNPVKEWSNWPLSMYFTNDEIDFQHRIQLCQQNQFYFVFCRDEQEVQEDQKSINSVSDRWEQLVTQRDFTLTVFNQGSSLNYNVFLNGPMMDVQASNLPYEPQNTIF